jgi:hypothetical protein
VHGACGSANLLLGGMWSYARGYPGKSGFGSASTAEDVTEGLSLEDYTAIITGTCSILIT